MKKILLFLVLLPLFLFVVSPSHADYSPNFTATNVVFNLSTYHLEFDYSGAPFTDSQIFSFDLRNVNADTTGLWWRSSSGTTITCSNNHCSGNLTGLVNPSYPSPYPTGSQQMVLQVYIDSTSTEYFSQSFTYSSTGGYVCLPGSPQSGYTPTFTASNIVFTPATKKLSFDYSGASFTDSQIQSFDLRNIDAATTGLWWRSSSGTAITCSNNHCEGFLTGAVNGSYPTLWPTDPQYMVVDVYTGSEHFSQGFTFGSIWQGGACFKQITALNPAEVWLSKGLLNVGLRLDLLAEAYKDNTLVSSGQLNSVQGGSGGFNNADLISIPFNSFSPVNFPQGSQLKLKLSVRNACSGSLLNQGTARLWFNDNQANSHFGATIGTTNSSYYLLDNFLLSTTVGAGPRQNIDVQAGAKCSPFKPFGTWTITP